MAKQEMLVLLNLLRVVLQKFFDEQTCLKAMRSSCLGTKIYWVPIEKCESEIPSPSASPSIKCTLLMLSWASARFKSTARCY